jgi:hypothetical protein
MASSDIYTLIILIFFGFLNENNWLKKESYVCFKQNNATSCTTQSYVYALWNVFIIK